MRINTTLVMFVLFISLSATSGYKKPSEKVTRIFNVPAQPYLSFRNFSKFAMEISYQSEQSLEQLADPFIELAGIKISKRLNGIIENYPIKSIALHEFSSGKKREVIFPDTMIIRKLQLSPDENYIAFTYEKDKGIFCGVINTHNGKIKLFDKIVLNDAFDFGAITWFSDSKRLLISAVVPGRKSEPVKSFVPDGPIIEEAYGKNSKLRTYQNLLKDKYDERLFDYFFTSQLAILNVKNGKAKALGKPGIYNNIDISPDQKYLLVTCIVKPYSYQVPYSYFPKNFEVWSLEELTKKILYSRPLQDELPIGGTFSGPRNFEWHPGKEAELIYVEALDEGNPDLKVPYRDQYFSISSPAFTNKKELFRTENRTDGVQWGSDHISYIYSDYDREKIWSRSWLVDGTSGEEYLIDNRSIKDEYTDKGHLVLKKNENGFFEFLIKDKNIFFYNNVGASPKGSFPYLMSYNYETNESRLIFECRNGYYEYFISAIDEDFKEIVIASETNTSPRNYLKLNTETLLINELTYFVNPYPQYANLKKEIVYYRRDDGVELSGTLFLPSDFDGKTPLPLIINAYPEEYTDSETAGQKKESPFRFDRFWSASAKYLALDGYAVLTGASIPIIGDPETVNETFVEQLLSSVEAAINYLAEEGIADKNRVGIIGHSYGAFMVANTLAHSDLCAAGIAKSGAYNRTLTPFGFQSERRTLWEAKDFYLKVSPFMFAEQINEPLLLIHGQEDSNSGTYPMQSERLFQAIKGNGGIVKLTMLPFEGHSYVARESNLHVLAETIEWFDKYVKNRIITDKEEASLEKEESNIIIKEN